jgi:hypothetical protein
MLVPGYPGRARCLVAPAIVGEAAILIASMPELARRTASFRALGRACMAWRLAMADLQAGALPYFQCMLFSTFRSVSSRRRPSKRSKSDEKFGMCSKQPRNACIWEQPSACAPN